MKALLEFAVENKKILNTKLLVAYSDFYKKEQRWLTSVHSEKTIQELIDDACDTLEEQGHDLSETTIDVVFDEIHASVSVAFSVPVGYTALNEAREEIEATLLDFRMSGITSPEIEKKLSTTLYEIEIQMKNISNDQY